MESCCLLGTEFFLGIMKKVLGMDSGDGHVFSATELHIYE